MSQQINLLLPELRPRFDSLGLPLVAGAAVAGLLLLLVLVQVEMARVDRLKAQEAGVNAQVLALNEQVKSMGRALAGRQGNSSLPPEIETTRTAVAQRQEVLTYVGQGAQGAGQGFARLLQGFSRQTVNGVWLVGFGLAQSGIEIRGRLTDPALLPVYINKLNGDQAFAGLHFSALNMTGVEAVIDKQDGKQDAKTAPTKTVSGPYTEFALRTDLAPAAEKTR